MLTGYVLGEELSALGDALVTTGCERVPQCFDGDVVIGTRDDKDIFGGGVANLRAVAG